MCVCIIAELVYQVNAVLTQRGRIECVRGEGRRNEWVHVCRGSNGTVGDATRGGRFPPFFNAELTENLAFIARHARR